MSKTMYSPFQIGNLMIANRLVASAMFEYGAENGRISDKIRERYEELSKGGAGLIITGMQAVRKAGSVASIMVNTEYAGYVQDMQEMAAAAHAHGAKLIVQLQHCGVKTSQAEGYDKFSVSEMQVSSTVSFHEASKEELQKLVQDYVRSALCAQEAGADGAQIHAAHGFLLNSFLSPITNKRTDEYGGRIENRARLVFEIYEAVRAAVGKDYVLGIKFPFSDLKENSIQPEESLWVCRELEKWGIDFIEISSGMAGDDFSPVLRKNQQAPFLPYGAKVAETVTVPVISVCGYRTPEVIEKALAETKIAAVSFGRPLVCEPDLPLRWKKDPSPARCVSCNGCFKSAPDGIIACQMNKARKKAL